MAENFVLFAPGVHTGGGLVLLNSVLFVCNKGVRTILFLDSRARGSLQIPANAHVFWIAPTLTSRFKAEALLKDTANSCDTILCLNGLPPLMRCRGKIVVFVQNRNMLDRSGLQGASWDQRFKPWVQGQIGLHFSDRVSEYIVQTPSMRDLMVKYLARKSLRADPQVTVFPFSAELPERALVPSTKKHWDFVYPSDGVPHKNHEILLKAWCILASEGLRPSLVLTLCERDVGVKRMLAQMTKGYGLLVVDKGQLPFESLPLLYAESGALIFPSLSESLGLPLIEASHFGLPILAAELDYVRDVCNPDQTFDPKSAISVARAIRRHLGKPHSNVNVLTASAFLEYVVKPKL